MTITDLVDRGLAIRKQIVQLKKELDGIEQKLAAAGLERQQELLADEDREGRRWFAPGSRLLVPVVFTADKLIASFAADSPKHREVAAITEGKLKDFFHLKRVYEMLAKDGKDFRLQAGRLLGADKGPALITACLARDRDGVPKSDVKVDWGGAEEKS